MNEIDGKFSLKGTVENIIFRSSENGYTVFSLDTKDEEVVCTAYIPAIKTGENVILSGNYVTHHIYGPQFNVVSYEKDLPTTATAIEKYLGSGAVKGIGSRLANRIVETFGEDTLHVIENEPQALAKVKGISKAMAENIANVFNEDTYLRKIVLSLQEYGVSPAYAMKIYKRYKDQSLAVVKENPYILSAEVVGIGFKTADKIAANLGVDPYSAYRIKAGVRYILSQVASGSGHVCTKKEDLLEAGAELLEIDPTHIDNCLIEMQLEKTIVQEKIKDQEKTNDSIVVYLSYFYHAENYVAKKLLELSALVIEEDGKLQERINEAETQLNIALATEQRKAVSAALAQGVLVITGGPGTGKTTIIKTIITLLQKEGYMIELAAPTGRATKRMTEATGIEAKTIHRLLGVSLLREGPRQNFERNEDDPIEADVIVIDEMSMVDLMLMYYLLKAVAHGTRLILVGDSNQLPSVGPGNVLRDIINSGCIQVVALEEIFRQAAKSLVVTNAHRINMGQYPILNEKEGDFFFIRRQGQEDVVNTIIDLCSKRLLSYGLTQEDIQVLCPMRKSTIGATNLNIRLQQILNPHSHKKNQIQLRSTTFREGDKVMQIKNNYNLEWKQKAKEGYITGFGVFNGDEGYITEIEQDSVTVVFYDGKVVIYGYKQLEELNLSYAITVHKAQGSEYKAVVIPIHNGPPMLHNRNLLYTALTRAKQLAIFVGIETALHKMVDNDSEIERNSFLRERIIKINEIHT
ncbi:MAG: ATP-dependent RecD-like DNA helicase [Defluviitaleaceae bacterium]|nr:ATP-dependent RecD-like DNA helicase [Defluviitaleaceae bacterium]